jgi:hypothetical protein
VNQVKKKVQSIAQSHKKAGLQSSTQATSFVKTDAQKKKVNDIAQKVK